MRMNCQQLLKTRSRVLKAAPMLAVHIDRLLWEAKDTYARHGSPDGPGDDKAFAWYERRHNHWDSTHIRHRA